MECLCTNQTVHKYLCKNAPKCHYCQKRLDISTHINDCIYNTICDSCGSTDKNHPIHCKYHIRCEFCGITETMLGSIHYYGCPKWYHEYNQRRIELLRTKILNTQFNLNEFRKANITLNTDFMIPIPCLRHITHKTNKDCPICLQEKSNCRTTCGHFFHKSCLEEWLQISQTCPICKKVNFF